jgi:hypothetical protein
MKDLIKIGQRAYCAGHEGKLVAYYTAESQDDVYTVNPGLELYGVLLLDEPYKSVSEDGGIVCYIRHLTVHHSNLTTKPDRPDHFNGLDDWDF